MRKTNGQKGITLVALVITIIILLILATISIQSLTNTGLFAKAKEAKEKSQNAEENQAKILNEYEDELNKYISGNVKNQVKKIADNINKVLSTTDNTELQDSYGNKIVVPAGFKIVTDSTINIDKGVVIEDATSAETAGSQFVWVPVGTIYTNSEHIDSNKKIITLGRYDFDEITGAEKIYVGDYVEEDRGDTTVALKNYGNKIAQNITDFKNSVTKNGGYYIGRYEARKNSNGMTTEIATDTVYYDITQQEASEKSQNMYSSTEFTSDLINSYAWDTTIVFLKNCGTNNKYALQTCLNNSLLEKGTTNDIQCNIYDIASNVSEWTTETTDNKDAPCVGRGGNHYNTTGIACSRGYNGVSDKGDVGGFRPIIYLK